MKMRHLTPFILTLLLFCGCVPTGEAAIQAEANTNTSEYHYNLGVRYLSEGNYQEAILAFTAAIEIDPKSAPAYTGLAEAYITLDQIDAAITVLEQASERLSDSVEIQEKKDTIDRIMLLETPFEDTRANQINIPGGAMSCAARVISFTPGEPWSAEVEAMDREEILGTPDRELTGDGQALTLGVGGEIVLAFDVFIL